MAIIVVSDIYVFPLFEKVAEQSKYEYIRMSRKYLNKCLGSHNSILFGSLIKHSDPEQKPKVRLTCVIYVHSRSPIYLAHGIDHTLYPSLLFRSHK